MNERELSGYKVTYARDESQFPVYVLGSAAALLLAGGLASGISVLIVLGVVALAGAFFNYPLLETGRARIGANQYGIFVEGFGIIGWRAVDRIDYVPIASRVTTSHELQIGLKMPLTRALVADWRKMPWYRLLMRLPWSMTHDNVIRINLDPFADEPEEIHRTVLRMWRYYRS